MRLYFQVILLTFNHQQIQMLEGLALFTKNKYKTTERKYLKIVNSDAVGDLWFEVTNTIDETFLISVIYRHPKENVSHFSDSMEDSVTKIIDDRKIKDCIIVGDMNIEYHVNKWFANNITTNKSNKPFMPINSFATRYEYIHVVKMGFWEKSENLGHPRIEPETSGSVVGSLNHWATVLTP